jgi:hypothetical protein
MDYRRFALVNVNISSLRESRFLFETTCSTTKDQELAWNFQETEWCFYEDATNKDKDNKIRYQ